MTSAASRSVKASARPEPRQPPKEWRAIADRHRRRAARGHRLAPEAEQDRAEADGGRGKQHGQREGEQD